MFQVENFQDFVNSLNSKNLPISAGILNREQWSELLSLDSKLKDQFKPKYQNEQFALKVIAVQVSLSAKTLQMLEISDYSLKLIYEFQYVGVSVCL